jgi:DNA-binding response OmpR family regulator
MPLAAAVRVLLVEPHADTRELYGRALTSIGWEVVTATDGASASRAFFTHQPTVVVSETRLPDGGEAALLRAFADAGVAVVALTTAPPYQHRDFSGMRLSAVLMKPCLPDVLARAVRHVIETSGAQDPDR